MALKFTPHVILQFFLILLDIFGGICALVLFREKNAHSILVSFVIIFYCVLDCWTLIADFPFISLIAFVENYIGRGILYIIIGCLFSSSHGLRLACWIIFWLAGILNIILNFLHLPKFTPLASLRNGVSRENYDYQNNNQYANVAESNEKADAYAPLN